MFCCQLPWTAICSSDISIAGAPTISRLGCFAVRFAGSALAAFAIASGSAETKAADADPVPDQIGMRGVTPKVIYDGDFMSNLAGGLQRGSTYEGDLRLQVTVDGKRFCNCDGITVFINGFAVRGSQPSSYSGDAQGLSNIQAPSETRLEEAWVQRNFASGRFSVLAGRYDLNSEFYRLKSAGLFLNSSFGIGPEFSQSGPGGPSVFPSTAIGTRLTFKPTTDTVLRTAIMDGSPYDRPDGSHGAFRGRDGLLLVVEADLLTRPAPEEERSSARLRIGRASKSLPYESKLAIGVWHYTASFNDLIDVDSNGKPAQRHGSSGAYVLADKPIFSAKDNPEQQVSAFMQIGVGDSRVNRFGSYAGIGLVASGFVPSQPTDEIGLAIALARNGSHYTNLQQQLGTPVTPFENAIELTYLAQINKWLAVQPNIQYIIHPNTSAMVNNALAVQLRFEIAF
jgi:porin